MTELSTAVAPDPERELHRRADAYRRTGDFGCIEESESRGVDPQGRPLVLLGFRSLIADRFVRHALQRLTVVGLIDNGAAGRVVDGHRVGGDADLPDLARRHPGLLAVVCAFGDVGFRHFRGLATGLGLPVLSLPQAMLRAGLLAPDEPSDWLRQGHPDTILRVLDTTAGGRLPFDDGSRAVLASVLLFRMGWDPRWVEAVRTPADRAFHTGGPCAVGEGAVVVDAGAFDGDTARVFAAASGNRHAAIHAFEPDPGNHVRLSAAIAGIPRAQAHRFGLWSESGRLRFDASGGHGSRIDADGGGEVEVVALDEWPELRPTLIKMDIEGAELPALRGAARTIAEGRPALAIAVYHRIEDLAEIPAFLHGLRPDAPMTLAHHSGYLFDSMLYVRRAA